MRLLIAVAVLLGATLMAMPALLTGEAASAVELLDAELVAAGTPVLQNASGTVRLEQGQLDAVGRRVFVVPEPGGLWQLASGIGLLVFLARRRCRRTEKEVAAMKKLFRPRAPWLAILLMCLAYIPTFRWLLSLNEYGENLERIWMGQGRGNFHQRLQYAGAFGAYFVIVYFLLVSGYTIG